MKNIFVLFLLTLNFAFAQNFMKISEDYTLSNGLNITFIKNPEQKKISYTLAFKVPDFFQGIYIGHPAITTNLMLQETQNRKSTEIERFRKKFNANLRCFDNRFVISGFSSDSDSLLQLLSDIVRKPNFTLENMISLKKRLIKNVRGYNSTVEVIASNVYKRVEYDHSSPASEFVTEKSLKDISINVIKRFYDDFYLPNNCNLIVTGNFNTDTVKTNINKYFGDWLSKNISVKKDGNNKVKNVKNISLVNVENIDPFLLVGTPVPISKKDPEVLKLQLASLIYGHRTYRWQKKVDDTAKIDYYTSASLVGENSYANFIFSEKGKNESIDSLLKAYLSFYKSNLNTLITERELETAKKNIVEMLVEQIQQPELLSDFVADFKVFGYNNNYIENYLTNIKNIKANDVNTILKKYFSDTNAVVVVVGDSLKILDKLKKIKPVKFYDNFGNYVDTYKPTMPKGFTADSILNKFIALSTKGKGINAIKNLSFIYKGEHTQGEQTDVLQTVESKSQGGKFYKETFKNGKSDSKTISDGKKFYRYSDAFGDNYLSDNDAQDAKYEASILPQAELDSLGIQRRLEGIEKINGSFVYRIKMINKQNKTWDEYYDFKTYELVRDEKVTKSVQFDLKETNNYSNYKDFDGFVMPTKIDIQILNQGATFNIDNVKVNKSINESIYKIPAKTKENAKIKAKKVKKK